MIVIPMAGLSARFQRAGFQLPKYMLMAHGRSLFDHAVSSFKAYFESQSFLFVFRDVDATDHFVRSECARLGINTPLFVSLDAPTRGQAETVALGLERAAVPSDVPITIFNIDTFRPGFRFPDMVRDPHVDGYLEVFHGSGANWSFARTESIVSDRVVETAEKRPISDLCCSGLYHFRQASDFQRVYREAEQLPLESLDAKELYVAPLYNSLIREGKDIRVDIVKREEIIFCGVPDEYNDFLREQPASH